MSLPYSLAYPVPTALDIINRLFTEQSTEIEDPEAVVRALMDKEQVWMLLQSWRNKIHNTIGLEKDEVMQLLKLVLENCVFTFQDKFFKQLHG